MPNRISAPETAFEIRHQMRGPGGQAARCASDQCPGPSDDMAGNPPAFGPHQQTRAEFLSAIRSLGDDERRELMALILMVRGELDLGERQTSLTQWDAIDRARAARPVSGSSFASDYLEEVLIQCGRALAQQLDRH